MFEACPISRDTRNERVVRVVAAFVVAIVTIAVVAGSPWSERILLVLTIDFVIRGFSAPKRSPLATLARGAVNSLGLTPKPVDAGPKRFAARLGIGFSAVASLLYFADAATAGATVAIVLAVCAFLEASFALCVGCRVYALLPRRLANALAR